MPVAMPAATDPSRTSLSVGEWFRCDNSCDNQSEEDPFPNCYFQYCRNFGWNVHVQKSSTIYMVTSRAPGISGLCQISKLTLAEITPAAKSDFRHQRIAPFALSDPLLSTLDRSSIESSLVSDFVAGWLAGWLFLAPLQRRPPTHHQPVIRYLH